MVVGEGLEELLKVRPLLSISLSPFIKFLLSQVCRIRSLKACSFGTFFLICWAFALFLVCLPISILVFLLTLALCLTQFLVILGQSSATIFFGLCRRLCCPYNTISHTVTGSDFIVASIVE